ncbi:hypothetical protein [Rhodopirellula sp. MGV]|uniref:hypothetical protein n=1 Tax=Rhodopirellula sp. MGV TaxID=2023130 RepID=UPI000B9721F3|nr:hypothetical protein [Rhodopirellula sp. MGV]OYP30324.1 hypothetical protein CGZ80_22820 [Rhodopirellula sp. MGV]PNY34680.1 hypothetical protein C2E31_22165 [Rhodopirellula baltica]
MLSQGETTSEKKLKEKLAMLFQITELQALIDLQQRSYRLLRWVADGVDRGFLSFSTAHRHSSLPGSAQEWLREHYQNIPENARPDPHEVERFCAFFTTYLTNSFDLHQAPGQRRYSPDAHCFCPMCSWLVDAPHLQTKKLSNRDKRRAHNLRITAIKHVAVDLGEPLEDQGIQSILDTRDGTVDASLIAYGFDLRKRIKGIATGPAILSLWRSFAWHESGSPNPEFELQAEMFVQAELQVRHRLTNDRH